MRLPVALGISALTLSVLAPSAVAAPAATDLYTEDFDGLTSQLQTRVDETIIPADLLGWTPTAPEGWTVTNHPSMSDLGMTEWRGWTFATPQFWTAAAPGQGREMFEKASGVLAVADNDEWDDPNDPWEQLFESTLTSPAYDVTAGSTVHINFDSSYRQTGPQVAALEVSFDGGAPERLFEYSTEVLGDQVYLQNRTLTQPVEVPAGVSTMEVSWVIEQATNDWYWAIDNIAISDTPAEGAEKPLPDPPKGVGDLPDGVSDKKVLVLDFDGLRLNELRKYHTPNLDALAADGQMGVSYLHDNALGPTVSGNGHASLLTGVWSDKHRSPDNNFVDVNVAEYPDFLTRLETANPDFSTLSLTDWAPLNQHVIGQPDVKIQQDAVAGTKVSDKQTADDVVEALTTRNPDALFVYLHDGDAVGHCCTAESPEYKTAVETLDQRVGEIVNAVRSRESYAQEDWLILASTDHGFTGNGHGGDQHLTRKVWTIASGGDIPVTGEATREWRITDIAPTALAHMGVEIDPAWGLDGVPIGTASTDPFDTVQGDLGGVVDEPAKPEDTKGWTKQTPADWEIDEHTPEVGTTEYRGWSFMSGEFWTTSQEGEGRGSFVRGRDVVAVADADEWNDTGSPAADGARMDSTLYSPWQQVDGNGTVDVNFFSHYKQKAGSGLTQKAQVIAEYDDGTTHVLWRRNAVNGARFDVSRLTELSTQAPAGAREVRIGWRIFDAADNGYWAIDAPSISTAASEPEPEPEPTLPTVTATGHGEKQGKGGSRSAWRAAVDVDVTDASGDPLPDATVQLRISASGRPVIATCETDRLGHCTIERMVRGNEAEVQLLELRDDSIANGSMPLRESLVIPRP